MGFVQPKFILDTLNFFKIKFIDVYSYYHNGNSNMPRKIWTFLIPRKSLIPGERNPDNIDSDTTYSQLQLDMERKKWLKDIKNNEGTMMLHFNESDCPKECLLIDNNEIKFWYNSSRREFLYYFYFDKDSSLIKNQTLNGYKNKMLVIFLEWDFTNRHSKLTIME